MGIFNKSYDIVNTGIIKKDLVDAGVDGWFWDDLVGQSISDPGGSNWKAWLPIAWKMEQQGVCFILTHFQHIRRWRLF